MKQAEKAGVTVTHRTHDATNVSIAPGKRPVLLLCCEFLDEFMFHSFSIIGNWDSMEEYTCMIPRETQEGAFYRAALALHQNHFQQAQAVSVSWDGIALKNWPKASTLQAEHLS